MKFIAPIISLLILIFALAWKSYPLQDGYSLQGYVSHHGMIFKDIFIPVVTSEVMGVQGCKSGYLVGFTFENRAFIINTQTNNVSWHQRSPKLDQYLKSVGCKHIHVNNEINLAGFKVGNKFVSL